MDENANNMRSERASAFLIFLSAGRDFSVAERDRVGMGDSRNEKKTNLLSKRKGTDREKEGRKEGKS